MDKITQIKNIYAMTFAGYESPIPVILNFITLERFPAQRERQNMFMILSSWLKIFYVHK